MATSHFFDKAAVALPTTLNLLTTMHMSSIIFHVALDFFGLRCELLIMIKPYPDVDLPIRLLLARAELYCRLTKTPVYRLSIALVNSPTFLKKLGEGSGVSFRTLQRCWDSLILMWPEGQPTAVEIDGITYDFTAALEREQNGKPTSGRAKSLPLHHTDRKRDGRSSVGARPVDGAVQGIQ